MVERGEAHRMCRYYGRNGRSSGMRAVGIALILLGALLLVLVVPPRLWAAILGVVLIGAGVVLVRLG